MQKSDLMNGSFVDLTTRRKDAGAAHVIAAVDALVVQSFGQAIPTERVREMIVDAVCASLLLIEKLGVNENAEANLKAVRDALPARLAEIRNGRPVGTA